MDLIRHICSRLHFQSHPREETLVAARTLHLTRHVHLQDRQLVHALPRLATGVTPSAVANLLEGPSSIVGATSLLRILLSGPCLDRGIGTLFPSPSQRHTLRRIHKSDSESCDCSDWPWPPPASGPLSHPSQDQLAVCMVKLMENALCRSHKRNCAG